MFFRDIYLKVTIGFVIIIKSDNVDKTGKELMTWRDKHACKHYTCLHRDW